MNKLIKERLYDLLPAIYRIRDAKEGEPLRALLAVIEHELHAIEEDIEGLYDDWFIETCDEWVIPYIGDLMGVRPLHPASPGYSHRAYVANTLAYRRRKGTATVLEQLARDITGWPARAVECFQLLATTQHVNHLRLGNVRTPDLRDTNRLELLDGPFDKISHTAEVRRIAGVQGKYNIPNIGIFLWRLQGYPIERVTAREIDSAQGHYTFNPLGYDIRLFNRPQTETEITHLAEEINVPGFLRRRPLYDELEALRQAMVNGVAPPGPRYFGREAVLDVFLAGDYIKPEEILICNLDPWSLPPDKKKYVKPDGTQVYLPIRVAVDPVLGRVALPASEIPDQVKVEVSYAYGFSGDVGGGPYDRVESVRNALDRPVTWQIGVSGGLSRVDGEVVGTLTEALEEWEKEPAGSVGVIAILDNRTYSPENLPTSICMPDDSLLVIVAADWPQVDDPDTSGHKIRVLGQLVPHRRRSHLQGNLEISGSGELVFDGLLIEGKLMLASDALARLRIAHCTLVPEGGGIEVQGTGSLRIELDRSICGPMKVNRSAIVTVTNCIVSSGANSDETEPALDAPDAAARIEATTVFGKSTVRSLDASDCIFTGAVTAVRRQVGCMRFCYLPLEVSRTPRRYRCQPELALDHLAEKSERTLVTGRLRLAFTSRAYGDSAYAQLAPACAEEIRTGAENGSEMGVFQHLYQPQRETNLRISLEEYLPAGLEAGIFYVT